jgi:2,5-furandicarboxylate decarboxylase 1
LAVIEENMLLFNGATPNIRKIVENTVGQGEELEVNILIGPPVEIILLACMSLRGEDKLRITQALSGDGLAFSMEGLPFPHQSEYVLKATVIPEYQKEGPFGDLLGLYSVKEKNPECHVSQAICRKNPIYHSVMAGVSHEHAELVAMGARFLLDRIKRKTPGVTDYQVPSFGVGRMALIKVVEGFNVEEIVSRLWSLPIVRLMIFVNEDVDISSPLDIFWAVIQRAKEAEDFQFSEKMHPVFKEKKVVVDATVSELKSWGNRRIKVFGE